ncbi:carboxylating nicotinate-nucleotide diphosphorylase [Candidatus Sumerlaeota bacterium]|nr:carboxylating nicotinate-nucleotide diphosphorylase [Candidatus Sumerlaeota bacterium]
MAIKEDVGSGDVTSQATVPAAQEGVGSILAREAGILCGVDVARAVMRLVDPGVKVEIRVRDGEEIGRNVEIARLYGKMRSILAAERIMLNFLQHLSGVATLTRRYVDLFRELGSGVRVTDTRKTTPLWRELERHAVRAGGGINHRFALYDMYLIKNNHVDAAGGVGEALRRVWKSNPRRRLRVAVETRNIAEVREALEVGADLVLLDNMRRSQMRRAVEILAGRVQTEATGGVSLRRARALASLPVDRVSIGALTHSAPALDIALRVRRAGV